MRLSGLIGVVIAASVIASCESSAPPAPPEPEKFWFNVDALKLSESSDDLKHYATATDRDTAECEMERLKIAIPAPSCLPRNCAPENTFCKALGPSCDRSAVVSAYRSRSQIFQACMTARGYGEFTLEDFARFYPEQVPKLQSIAGIN